MPGVHVGNHAGVAEGQRAQGEYFSLRALHLCYLCVKQWQSWESFLGLLRYMDWRRMASSKSTCQASNSGPSTHVKRVWPPTVTRQAPHMPVPSTIRAFKLTTAGRLCSMAAFVANFIIIIGPIITQRSYFLPWRTRRSSIRAGTIPWKPAEPSSVQR